MKFQISLLCVLMSFFIQAQERHPRLLAAIEEIREFTAIPNDASNLSDIDDNIIWLKKRFAKRGFSTMVLKTSNAPLFFANTRIRDDRPTVLFYMHFDGQPVDAKAWNQPNPYQVVLKQPREGNFDEVSWEELEKEKISMDLRLFGRSVSDDKGPIIMFLNAYDELLASGREPAFNIKVILDGEEEKSSKPLPEAVRQYRELLQADMLIINDGPVHASGKPTIVFGCRGITSLQLTSYGPIAPQHSGHYGNYAPNPAFTMAHLLSSLKKEDGSVLVEGFYEGIELDEPLTQILAEVPDDQEGIRKNLAIHSAQKPGNNYQESLQFPSLNVRGLSSGWTGSQTRTIIPDRAVAEIDIRLVPETPGARQKSLIREYLTAQGYHLVDDEPGKDIRTNYDKVIRFEEGSVTDAFRTDMNHPYASWLQQVLQTTFEEEPVRIRIMGGTVPIAPFINALEVPAFIVPLVNPDNNQHSPDENITLEQINYGLRFYEGLFSSSLTGI
ncbi:M20/M25/M40 family metallo-hydrolase [Robertkochia aurantiaca]|uniref:M20/M25/M40 family metallo-hydrolase n=1 Tax=Robertkochia aurantiaca TaxID=2873700 RepID=UPI001CCB1486|nr:M20/M25/M40 family metallo-hydrolase [Robertkochia sp. 3YJGBD-33]